MHELSKQERREDGLVGRLLAIGRDCAARLGAEYVAQDHDAFLYDDQGLPCSDGEASCLD